MLDSTFIDKTSTIYTLILFQPVLALDHDVLDTLTEYLSKAPIFEQLRRMRKGDRCFDNWGFQEFSKF